MKCVVCKKGETKSGKATVTLEKDGATLVFKGVPAQVCASRIVGNMSTMPAGSAEK